MKRIPLLLLFVPAVLLSADDLAAPITSWTYPPEMPGARVEVYRETGDTKLNAYIFTPEGHEASDRRPAAVFFFGGGWKSGTPGQFLPHCLHLSKKGIVAISVDYRVASRQEVTPLDCVSDAKAAIRWVRANAARLGIDPDRIAAGGGSAGGHLAAATALVPGFEDEDNADVSSTPNALILFNPAVILAPVEGDNDLSSDEVFRSIDERCEGRSRDISPYHFVKAGLPPSIIFHGTNDDAVPFATIQKFEKAMLAAGNRCEVKAYEGQPHGFFNPGRKKGEVEAEALKCYHQTLGEMDDFLSSLGYLESTETVDATTKPKTKPAPVRLPDSLVASLEAHPDLTYARYGERELELDLYRPKGHEGLLPAIVCIHGGGWFQGDRKSMTNLAQALAARGFVAVTVSYRLSGEAKFPAAIHDCKAAVRWLRANAEKYGVDREKIGVTGLSAGGHLAALMATSGGVAELEGEGGNAERSSAVQACVAMGAQSDLETDRIREISAAPENPHYRPFLGGALEAIPATYALASPRHHLDKSDPPIIFMAGELDDPSTHADETRMDLEALGIPTEYIEVPGAPHGFLGQQAAFDFCLDASEAYFSKHLKSVK